MPPRVLVLDPDRPDPRAIAEAAAALRGGGIVAFPTETVYGLGADALSEAAVRRVFEAKGRPLADPIIVHVARTEDLDRVARVVPRAAREMTDAHWPGPLTVVVPRAAAVPPIVTAGLDGVAVRAPSHPVARALLAAFGGPIAAPSANPFGRTSPTRAEHVVRDMGSRVDLVLDGGPCPVGVESTVVDCRSDPPVLLRPGGVPLEDLARWGVVAAGGKIVGAPVSPGLMARHYAPRARVVLVMAADQGADVAAVLAAAAVALAARSKKVGLLVADEDLAGLDDLPGAIVRSLGPRDDDVALARSLFATLRELDAAGVDVVLARDFGGGGLATAVSDRLVRAAEWRSVFVGREPGGAVLEVVRRAAPGGAGPTGSAR